ncbi:MAG: response regulator [Chloroflexi bacterium]|nr:response regulator [Chloroflexota bacterium]
MNTTKLSNGKNSIRILVVDDHPATAATLARAISQLGPEVDVISASSGKEALESIAGDYVDMLITDMMMPGMNGLELIEHIQANSGGKPAHIVLVTAYDVPGLRETARRLRVDETIIKPVRPERICQIVTNVMKSIGNASAAPVEQPTTETQPFNILIADDMPDNVTLLSRYMKNEGYNYITASNGVEALEKTRTEMPDLVLLDVNMPQKDGLTVLKEIRADSAIAHIPVIIFTAARLHPDDVQAGLNLGADDYITKPFDRRELFARIRAKLRTKSFEDAIRRRNRQLSMLPEIGKELSARLDINELTSVVLRRTVEMLGAIMGHIVLFDPHHPIRKTYNTSTTVQIECPNFAGFLKAINESRESILIDDVQNAAGWQQVSNDPTRSAAIVPMFGRNNLLGILALVHEKTHYFQMESLLLLQAIASQAAIAIENALLYEGVSQQQKRLSAVLQSADEAIFMFDAEGRLSLLNPAGEKLFTDFKASLNQPLEEGHGYDALIQMVKDALHSGGSKSEEILWPDERVFMVLITPIESGGLVAVLHDITRFKDIDRVKNEFIATASHDLKNPITSILGFSELLAQAGPLNDIQADFARRIQNAAFSMTELVQNLMQLAQADLNTSRKHEVLEVGSLLTGIVDEFKTQAKVREQILQYDQPEVPAHVNGDPLQLKQLFRNLIGNAIKYTPCGEKITLSVNLNDEYVQVDVRDNGYGIPAEDLPYVFDRFYRVRSGKASEVEGNGLGLAIVKAIAEQHDGQVSVESELSKGSRFIVTLPYIATTGETTPSIIDFSNHEEAKL